MRAYMVGGRYPEDAAVLVFAHTAREAKRMGYRAIDGLWGEDFLNVRVRWLRNGAAYHCEQDTPHVVDSPDACRDCDMWYPDGLDDHHRCKMCADAFDDEE